MNVIEKYNTLKQKAEDFASKGAELERLMNSAQEFEDEVYSLVHEIQENNQETLPEGVEDIDSWCDDLYDLKYGAMSWLPSSMRC